MTETDKGQTGVMTQYWWLWLLEGLTIVMIGWWLLSQPIVSTMMLVQILGLYWFLAGFTDIIMAIVDREEKHRGLKILGGMVGIMAGWWVLNHALFAGLLTPTTFLWIIAFSFIINGVIKIFLGNAQSTGGRQRSWGSFFAGLFYGLMGLMLLAMPLWAGLATMVFSVGILAMVGGIGLMIMSFQMKGSK